MKKYLVILLLGFAVQVQAATSTSLTWTASPTAGIAGYHVYRANCSVAPVSGVCPTANEGTFALVGSSTVTSYADATATTVGSTYAYYVKAYCPAAGCSSAVTGESSASNHVAIQISAPPQPPQPPSGLSISQVTATNYWRSTFVMATWVDTTKTTFALTNAGGVLLTSGTRYGGKSTAYWIGYRPTFPLTFKVCDTAGCQIRKVTGSQS